MQSKLATPLSLHPRTMPEVLADIGGAELGRIVQAFAAAIEGRSAGTLHIMDGLNSGASWRSWFESVFQRKICPAFAPSHEAVRIGRYHEIASINGELQELLAPEEARRALVAGRFAWQETALPRRRKLVAEIGPTASELLLPTVFAIHAAIFHLPIVQSLQGYLWLEAVLAAGMHAPRDPGEFWHHVTASCASAIQFHASFEIS